MTNLLTAAEMRATEEAAMADGAVTGRALMERAGQGAVAEMFAMWPDLALGAHRARVLCGPGNNGGDGFVIARHLRARGWQVDVRLFGAADRLPRDARANHDAFRPMGEVRALEADALDPDTLSGTCDLVVDALFGTGLTRPVDLPLDALSPAARRGDAAPRILAVDMPSGLCSDSGRVIGNAAVTADLTVTFHTPKPGQYLSDGPARCGAVRVVDIGLSGAGPDGAAPTRLVTCAGLPALGKRPGHKYDHGHALILCGGTGRTGAARLAARGALRVGVGLVTLGVPGAAQLEVAAHETAVMLRRVEDADGLTALLSDARLGALCLGPGLGTDRARALVPSALAAERPTVLDADALTAFADAPAMLFDALNRRCVLTPHDGEFTRLFPDIAAPLREAAGHGPAFSRIDAARAAAERAGAVVLLKGPDTVIADPDGAVAVHASAYARAAPWLATAGAGDVLAGILTGFLARGLAPLAAAEAAAYVHAEGARLFGPGLIAEDLPETLPRVFRSLGF